MEIKKSVVRDICYRENDEDEMVKYEEWEFIYAKITGNDTEDGGASYEAVVKHIPTGKFYMADYNDWDFYWEYTDWKENDELDEGDPEYGRTIDNGDIIEIYQVWPKTITEVIYTNKAE